MGRGAGGGGRGAAGRAATPGIPTPSQYAELAYTAEETFGEPVSSVFDDFPLDWDATPATVHEVVSRVANIVGYDDMDDIATTLGLENWYGIFNPDDGNLKAEYRR